MSLIPFQTRSEVCLFTIILYCWRHEQYIPYNTRSVSAIQMSKACASAGRFYSIEEFINKFQSVSRNGVPIISMDW